MSSRIINLISTDVFNVWQLIHERCSPFNYLWEELLRWSTFIVLNEAVFQWNELVFSYESSTNFQFSTTSLNQTLSFKLSLNKDSNVISNWTSHRCSPVSKLIHRGLFLLILLPNLVFSDSTFLDELNSSSPQRMLFLSPDPIQSPQLQYIGLLNQIYGPAKIYIWMKLHLILIGFY